MLSHFLFGFWIFSIFSFPLWNSSLEGQLVIIVHVAQSLFHIFYPFVSLCCILYILSSDPSSVSLICLFWLPLSSFISGILFFQLQKFYLMPSKICLPGFNHLFSLSNEFQFILFYFIMHTLHSVPSYFNICRFTVLCVCFCCLLLTVASFMFNGFWVMNLCFLKSYVWEFFVAWVLSQVLPERVCVFFSTVGTVGHFKLNLACGLWSPQQNSGFIPTRLQACD